jgi:hypothetical protein
MHVLCSLLCSVPVKTPLMAHRHFQWPVVHHTDVVIH